MAAQGSMRAVLTAVASNGLVTIAKFVGFAFSGSSALLAEAVHSLADTANQSLLFLGLRRSARKADEQHHFGYGQERYFWNLVSAVTIFFIGCVYTVMHAVEQLKSEHAPTISWLAFAVVGLAFVAEGYSLLVALNEFNRQRKWAGLGFFAFITETRDPTTLAVLVEDTVAVFGLMLALAGMGLAVWTGSEIFDAAAAILIGLLMGGLAMLLASLNKRFLIDVADSHLDEVARSVWQADTRITHVERVNSIVLSPEETLLMAEVQVREDAVFAGMNATQVEGAMTMLRHLHELRRGMEADVRRAVPRARHIFIEFVGIADRKNHDENRVATPDQSSTLANTPAIDQQRS
ncbi:MAG TPA: cation diffusion facilitator family transporter [Mariprofundaceae bacterium]|nr:cation diffusion facilitator family transporter [Mariprofundaceae bacterium]